MVWVDMVDTGVTKAVWAQLDSSILSCFVLCPCCSLGERPPMTQADWEAQFIK